jgi:uncharacterized protein YkwD
MINKILVLFLFMAQVALAQEACLSAEEKALFDLLMDYRKSKGLPPISYSIKLTRVAQAHVRDLAAHFDYDNKDDCNPHSWSANGVWSSCCYTDDHRKASCMWNKPREIAGYESEGYEIAFFSSDGAAAQESLEGWKRSAGHNPVIVNSGTWQKARWLAIGIGIYENYAVVWFGQLADPSAISLCP